MVKNPSDHGTTRWLALHGAALLTVFCIATALVGGVTASVTGFQVGYLSGFAGYGLILLSLRRRATPITSREWALWIALCLLLRVPLIPLAPSDDVHRYIWEGLVQNAGFNPYTIPPDDPRLAGIDDALRARVNHPHFPAIYPPLAQLTFRAAAAISPTPLCFKLMHVAWDMITVLLLPGAIANGRAASPFRPRMPRPWLANSRPSHSTPTKEPAVCPRALALIYALCPLTLTAFALEGHVDSLMLMLLVATLRLLPTEPRASARAESPLSSEPPLRDHCSSPYSEPRASARAKCRVPITPDSSENSPTLDYSGGIVQHDIAARTAITYAGHAGSTTAIRSRAVSAGALLGCAISAKAVVVLLLPWLAFRRPMIAAIALVSAALWHIPYRDSALAPFRNLARFSQYGEAFSIAQLVRTTDTAPQTIRLVGCTILAAAVGWSAIRSGNLALHAHRSLAALLFVSPIVHAWYWTWLVALAPFHRARWPLVAAAACVLYYEAFRPLASGGAWQMPQWATATFWLVVSVFLAGKFLESAGCRPKNENALNLGS